MKKAALIFGVCMATVWSGAQVIPVWQVSFNDTRNSRGVDAVVTSDGGVVVAGTIETTTGSAWIAAKYSSSGTLVWSREIASSDGGPAALVGLGIDSSQNIYLGGHWFKGVANDYDFAWVKLSGAGTVLSQQTFNSGGGSELAVDFEVDANGTSTLVGNSLLNGISRGYLLRINASGTLTGATSIEEPGTGSDEITDLTINSAGTAFVCGFSQKTSNRSAPFIAWWPLSSSLTVQFGANPGVPNNLPRSIAVDLFGDVLVAGGQGLGPVFKPYFGRHPAPKYSAPESTIFTTSQSGTVTHLVIGPADVVYAAGTIEQPDGSDQVFLSKIGFGPNPAWTLLYGLTGRDDTVRRLHMDGNSAIYVSGSSGRAGGGTDFWVLKTTLEGTTAYNYRWTVSGVRGQGQANRVLPLGNKQVVVAGTIPTATGGSRMALTKLSENSEIKFRFTTPGLGVDFALVPLTLRVVNQATNQEFFNQTVYANVNGDYTLQNVPDATYRIDVTSPQMLNRRVNNFLVVGGSPVANIALPFGDSDADGFVSILDYLVVSDAFDSQSGDSNFNAACDFDRDGFVSILDYICLSTNYDLQADF